MAICVAAPINSWSDTLVPESNEKLKTPKFAGGCGAGVDTGGVVGVVVVGVVVGVGEVGDEPPPHAAVTQITVKRMEERKMNMGSYV